MAFDDAISYIYTVGKWNAEQLNVITVTGIRTPVPRVIYPDALTNWAISPSQKNRGITGHIAGGSERVEWRSTQEEWWLEGGMLVPHSHPLDWDRGRGRGTTELITRDKGFITVHTEYSVSW